jgi:hypothetical protein
MMWALFHGSDPVWSVEVDVARCSNCKKWTRAKQLFDRHGDVWNLKAWHPDYKFRRCETCYMIFHYEQENLENIRDDEYRKVIEGVGEVCDEVRSRFPNAPNAIRKTLIMEKLKLEPKTDAAWLNAMKPREAVA